MAKKLKIPVDFSDENSIIAISCHKREYWLAFQLNLLWKIDLRKQEDLPYFHPRANELFNFSFYASPLIETDGMFYLFSNSNQEIKLFPEHRNTDYFLILNGNIIETRLQEMLEELKQINGILTAYQAPHNSFKDLDNFLSDLELHMLNQQKKAD